MFFIVVEVQCQNNRQAITVDIYNKSIKGDIPFEEKFILKGAFKGKVDRCNASIEFSNPTDAQKKKKYLPYEANGGNVSLLTPSIISGKTNDSFLLIVPELHPNTEYKVFFHIYTKKLLSESQQRLFVKQLIPIIENRFGSDVYNDPNISYFECEIKRLLKNNFDFDIDNLYREDNSPVSFDINTDAWANKIFSIKYSQSNYDNAILSIATDINGLATSAEVRSLFTQLGNLYTRKDEFSDDMKSVLSSDHLIYGKEHSILTVDKTIATIVNLQSDQLKKLLWGEISINKEGHIEHKKDPDFIGFELLKNILHRLKHSMFTYSDGTDALDQTNLQHAIDYVDDFEDNLQAVKIHKKNITDFRKYFPQELNDYFAKSIEVFDLSTQVDVLLEADKNPYMGLDLGLGYEFQSKSLTFHQGINIYCVPVNKRTPLSLYQGGDKVFKRLSLYFALSQVLASGNSDKTAPFIDPGKSGMGFRGNLQFGLGYRLSRISRVNFSYLMTRANNFNPFEDNQIKLLPMVSFSMEIDVAKGLNKIF